MAGNVDNRTVQMDFDNATFESRAGTTLETLKKLNTSLDFSGSTGKIKELSDAGKNFSMAGMGDTVDGVKGKLSALEETGRKFNLGNMSSAVQGVSKTFLALSAVGLTVLTNLTNRAVDAGIKIGKSLSIDQVFDGLREYETKMGSIQTILANTSRFGTTLQDVTNNLDELNEYADKTIYNFGDMTKNIGLFTNAGIRIEDATSMIKGFSNEAAASGTNANDAARAAYQLSQALSAGQVRLMDWRSLTNAGMGNKNMQNGLIGIAEAMGVLDAKSIKASTIQKDFNASLESGWLTTDVMSTYLKTMAGDLDATALSALGLDQTMIDSLLKQAVTAEEAATKVRTLTQLMGTLKESVGSGWAETFNIVFGDFNEATELFTDLNNAIGGVLGKSSEARNEFLKGWKWMGGRTVLLEGLKNVFQALADVLGPVKRAFRDVFPPMTFQQLYALTEGFRDFTEKLKPGVETITNIRKVAQGFFAALEIGWTVIKETGKFIYEMFRAFVPPETGGKILGFFGDIGEKINDLNKILVEGGGIARFFDEMPGKIKDFLAGLDLSFLDGPIGKLRELKEFLVGAFSDFSAPDVDDVTDALGRFGGMFSVFDGFGEGVRQMWTKVKTIFGNAKKSVTDFTSGIREAFAGMGRDIADALTPGSFNPVFAVLNAGLIGGFILFLKKLSDGITINFDKGIFETIGSTFEELTGILSTMQAKLKAESLLKIAGAIALIVASVAVLSLIDPKKMALAMTGLAVGFGQLMSAFALISRLADGPVTGLALITISLGLIALASAVGVLTFAVKSLSELSWNELTKGLLGTLLLMGALAIAVQPLSANSGGMITAGLGMMAVGLALNVIARAVKELAVLNMSELGKGLLGVGAALAALTLAMKFMPTGMVGKGAGLLMVSVALNAIALAVLQFSKMNWKDMAKGLVGVGGALLIIAGAMKLMPVLSMPLIGAGLLLVSFSLIKIAEALRAMADLSWEELGKGLAGLAGSLLILAGGLHLMSGTLMGAAAVGVAAFTLGQLADVIKEFAGIKWQDMVKGLVGIAASLGVLGIAAALLSPAILPMLALGAALILIGTGFTLFGVGATLTAGAFAVLGQVGAGAIDVLIKALDAFILRIPGFLGALAAGLVEMLTVFLEATPGFIEAAVMLIAGLLEAVPKIVVPLGKALTSLIQTALQVVRDNFPDVVQTGFEMLMALLHGIEENIAEITETVINIVVEFINTLANNLDKIIDAGVNLVIKLVGGILSKLFEMNVAALELVGAFIIEIAGQAWALAAAGIGMIANFITGIASEATKLPGKAVELVLGFIGAIPGMFLFLVSSGAQIVKQLVDGITSGITAAVEWVYEKAKEIGQAIIDGIKDAIKGAAQGVVDAAKGVVGSAIDGAKSIAGILGSPSMAFYDIGTSVGNGLALGIDQHSAVDRSVERMSSRLRDGFVKAISELPTITDDILDFSPTITPVLDLTGFKNSAQSMNGMLNFDKKFKMDEVYADAVVIGQQTDSSMLERISSPAVSGPTEIKFEQKNYSPEALSTADINRRTRSIISLAKEELNVL